MAARRIGAIRMQRQWRRLELFISGNSGAGPSGRLAQSVASADHPEIFFPIRICAKAGGTTMSTQQGDSGGKGQPQPEPGPPPKDPLDYDLDGAWRLGFEPQEATDWAHELRLRLKEAGDETALRRADSEKWATGRRPQDEREWELEFAFQELANQRRRDDMEGELEYRVALATAEQAGKSDAARSWTLLAIVAAIVLMPAIGIVSGVAAQSFSQFIAPITGIAGTVIGYWFSQQSGGPTSSGRPRDQGGSTPPKSGLGFPPARPH
jgi:hypothetical protein